EREQAVAHEVVVAANEDVLPPEPRDVRRRLRLAAAAGLGGAGALQIERLPRRPRVAKARHARTPGAVGPHRIDDAGRHQHRGGEPRHQIFDPGLEAPVWHAQSMEMRLTQTLTTQAAMGFMAARSRPLLPFVPLPSLRLDVELTCQRAPVLLRL